MRVLLVEDDVDVARFVARGLAEQSYAVDVAATGHAALEAAEAHQYDLIILEVMVPPPNGFEVCRELRRNGIDSSILMLTARDSVADRIEGLDSGADAYLVKPFQFAELLARLRALLLRRAAKPYRVIEVADLRIDTRSHRVTRGADELRLTAKEYALLEHMALRAGRVSTREEIGESIWSKEYDPLSNLIEVYIGRLRRLVDRDRDVRLIHTVRGFGYQMDRCEP